MSEYSFNKKDIIQDKLNPMKQMDSMLKDLEKTGNALENMVENSQKAQENREKKEKFIKKSKEYAIYTTRFILLNIPSLLITFIAIYSILQAGLCITDYWFPKWYPDKYSVDWVKPFIKVLPYAFHKNSNALGHVVLNILVGIAAVVGIWHNLAARLEENEEKNWTSLGVYWIVTIIPTILCSLFIYTMWTPLWYDKLAGFVQVITCIAVLLGVISIFIAIGNSSGTSSSRGGSYSSSCDSEYENNDHEERISKLEKATKQESLYTTQMEQKRQRQIVSATPWSTKYTMVRFDDGSQTTIVGYPKGYTGSSVTVTLDKEGHSYLIYEMKGNSLSSGRTWYQP